MRVSQRTTRQGSISSHFSKSMVFPHHPEGAVRQDGRDHWWG
jgi:hypothetical protein